MGNDLTPKQENFCLAYLETGNASESYRRAYSATNMKENTITKRALELLEYGKIKGRLEELRMPIIERHNVTVDSLINELDEARVAALKTAQSSAAVSATMGKAKLLGFLVDKQEVTGKNGTPFVPNPAISEAVAKRFAKILGTVA